MYINLFFKTILIYVTVQALESPQLAEELCIL